MARDEFVDPLSATLGRLQRLEPRDDHDVRVRARCRAELAKIRARQQQQRRSRGSVALAAGAIALYIVSAITAALQVLVAAGS